MVMVASVPSPSFVLEGCLGDSSGPQLELSCSASVQRCGGAELARPSLALSLLELLLFLSVLSMSSPFLVPTHATETEFFSLAPPPAEQVSSNKTSSTSVPYHFSVKVLSIDRETC